MLYNKFLGCSFWFVGVELHIRQFCGFLQVMAMWKVSCHPWQTVSNFTVGSRDLKCVCWEAGALPDLVHIPFTYLWHFLKVLLRGKQQQQINCLNFPIGSQQFRLLWEKPVGSGCKGECPKLESKCEVGFIVCSGQSFGSSVLSWLLQSMNLVALVRLDLCHLWCHRNICYSNGIISRNINPSKHRHSFRDLRHFCLQSKQGIPRQALQDNKQTEEFHKEMRAKHPYQAIA